MYISKWFVAESRRLSNTSTKIGTNDWYRVQAYEVPIFNPRRPPKNSVFLYISTSDGGDFPRIIAIAVFHLILI